MRKFSVTGMSCAACSSRVERAVGALDGVDSCSVNLLTGTMAVESRLDDSEIIDAVVKAGYGAKPEGVKEKNTNNDNNNLQIREKKALIFRVCVSGALMLLLMYISMGGVMLGAPMPRFLSENPMNVALTELLLSAAVMLINGRFFINGVKGAIHLAPNMDTLVSLGSAASFVYSVALTFVISGRLLSGELSEAHELLHGLYFESAAMILVLISIGKLLESRAKARSTDAIKELTDMTPRTATVIRDGKETVLPIDQMRDGDIFVVRPGESLPADGVVLEGESAIGEAALTGESIPAEKTVGDKVYSATINGQGYLKCRATSIGEDTVISQIVKTVTDASATKAPIAKLADRVSGVFVPIVLGIALVTAALWWIIGGVFSEALARGISVLVISCPCALGLATPVAIMVGSGVGAKHGILFKSAEALEELGRAKIVVLDKTGTITEGKPCVTDILGIGVDGDELLRIAASLERKSEHPLARAVCSYASDRELSFYEVEDFVARSGSGVEGRINGLSVLGGNLAFVSAHLRELSDDRLADYKRLSEQGKTVMLFEREGELLGMIAVADRIREESRAAISELKDSGLRVVMLTGDNERVARAIAEECGVDEVVAGVLPDGKESVIGELCSQGKTIMVGDGINDAPALVRADVGVAIGGGTDIAIDSADVVLMRDSLESVCSAISLSRKTLINIKENLFWAFCYNIVGIPLAAGAFSSLLGWNMNPMFGAAVMSVSSFIVVMNALRLGFFKRKNKDKTEDPAPIIEKNNDNPEFSGKKGVDFMKKTLTVEGMMCPHCEGRVRNALQALDCVGEAVVSHESGTAVVTLTKPCDDAVLKKTVEDQGYPVISIS